MPTLQVRDLPEDISRALKARAAAEGRSLSEYVATILVREAARPTRAEILDRIASREPVASDLSSAELVSLERTQRQ